MMICHGVNTRGVVVKRPGGGGATTTTPMRITTTSPGEFGRHDAGMRSQELSLSDHGEQHRLLPRPLRAVGASHPLRLLGREVHAPQMRPPSSTFQGGEVTERELQATIVAAAKMAGWKCYHTYDSRRSEPGFPDLVLVRHDELIFWELKTEKGRVTEAQNEWLHALHPVEKVHSGIIRPADLDAAIWRLTRQPEREG